MVLMGIRVALPAASCLELTKWAREVTEEHTQDIVRGVCTHVERAAEHREALKYEA